MNLESVRSHYFGPADTVSFPIKVLALLLIVLLLPLFDCILKLSIVVSYGLLHLLLISVSLAIREIQIKTTLRFHLTPVGLAKIKNFYDSLCLRECEVKGRLLH